MLGAPASCLVGLTSFTIIVLFAAWLLRYNRCAVNTAIFNILYGVYACVTWSRKYFEFFETFRETVVIRDQLNFSTTTVEKLQSLVSSKTGLPVTVFRLCTKDGKPMFQCHRLENYGIELGSTIHLHVWDGWGDFLKAATQGHTKKVLRNTSPIDQVSRELVELLRDG